MLWWIVSATLTAHSAVRTPPSFVCRLCLSSLLWITCCHPQLLSSFYLPLTNMLESTGLNAVLHSSHQGHTSLCLLTSYSWVVFRFVPRHIGVCFFKGPYWVAFGILEGPAAWPRSDFPSQTFDFSLCITVICAITASVLRSYRCALHRYWANIIIKLADFS